MGGNRDRTATRLAAIEQAVNGRRRRGRTLAEIPHGRLIAELMSAGLLGDDLAAVKAGCLLPGAGDISGALQYIAGQEAGRQVDVAFWEAVNAPPEHHGGPEDERDSRHRL